MLLEDAALLRNDTAVLREDSPDSVRNRGSKSMTILGRWEAYFMNGLQN
jgi:hypothetical protein